VPLLVISLPWQLDQVSDTQLILLDRKDLEATGLIYTRTLSTRAKMGVGAVLEPLVVVTLLFGGAWINRATDYTFSNRGARRGTTSSTAAGDEAGADEYDEDNGRSLSSKNRSLSPSLLPSQEQKWRQRQLRFLGWSKTVETPNTAVFKNRFLSRVLHKFPFLVEAWYWALIYWVCASELVFVLAC